MRILRVVLVSMFVACSAAEAGESAWTVRFHGALVQSTVEQQMTFVNGAESRVEVGGSGGLGLGAEYRFSDRVGLELSAIFAALEIDATMSANPSAVTQSLELSMVPLTIGVPFHFKLGTKTDFYIAPTVSHVSYVDISSSVGSQWVESSVDVSSDTAPGFALGLDTGIGRGAWAFSTGLRYIKADAGETEVDPLIVTVGFAYRF